MVVLFQKNEGTQKYEEYRTLDLTNHASKMKTKIIKNRIKKIDKQKSG